MYTSKPDNLTWLPGGWFGGALPPMGSLCLLKLLSGEYQLLVVGECNDQDAFALQAVEWNWVAWYARVK